MYSTAYRSQGYDEQHSTKLNQEQEVMQLKDLVTQAMRGCCWNYSRLFIVNVFQKNRRTLLNNDKT